MGEIDELERRYARWREAEAGEPAVSDAEAAAAEAAFGALFAATMPDVSVRDTFADDTMRAVAEAAAHDAARARRVRRWGVAASLPVAALAAYFGTGPLLSLVSWLLVTGIDLFVTTLVWLASSGEARPDLWSVLAGMGRAAGAFIADPKVTLALLVLHGVAIAAFMALQRLLGAGPEEYLQ